MACHHYRIGRDILLCPSKYHYLSARILVRRSFNSRSFSTAPPIPSNGCLLVVGAGDSTGSAIARRFARSGFDVCLARRNGNKLANVVEGINCERASSSGATHGRAITHPVIRFQYSDMFTDQFRPSFRYTKCLLLGNYCYALFVIY